MKLPEALSHAAAAAVSVALLALAPAAVGPAKSGAEGTDAVSSASIALPDQPSGAFYVLVNTETHAGTLEDWRAFFTDAEEFSVIFEDVSCLTAEGDAAGEQLAQRFQAQLPENQMRLRREDPTLLASKAETGYIDVAVFSREMAEALALDPRAGNVAVIEIGGD